ncbi:MAG: type II toxin-antitoxin system VapB family antitoxin [Dehalococcoidia bacterium]|nr:type II toxin-antitoxin system VapB family antitoxin [Dehalococcoidia bacterium]MCA9831419.1 type II toxin-antitoxin system VapB family antitoxin [Dehalococcoidia bacterium]MCB9485470.1 type II toxin-antitoxin system VapB family antitoxin [Thermoflexaceae bacterium]
MVLTIKSAKVDQLARELASLPGESISQAVESALEARLDTERRRCRARSLGDIIGRFRALPVVDDRSADEILGYDRDGLSS